MGSTCSDEIQMNHLQKESPTLSGIILRTSETRRIRALATEESKGSVSRVCRQELTRQIWESTVFEGRWRGDLEGHGISWRLGGEE